jgi:hypothetical protein
VLLKGIPDVILTNNISNIKEVFGFELPGILTDATTTFRSDQKFPLTG